MDDGYKLININGKVMPEHRYIMEQHLGRKLYPKEIIHHINRNKRDNRIENLMIVTNAEHRKIHGLLQREDTIRKKNEEKNKPKPKPFQYLTPDDVAAMLEVDKKTIRDMVKRGEIPYMKVVSLIRFDPNVLEEWMKNRIEKK